MSTNTLQTLKKTLTAAKRLPSYNFREYFGRRVQADIDLCRQGKFEGDAQQLLEQMRRMVTVSRLYSTDKLVVESLRTNKSKGSRKD
jgi:hypothetical protein